MTPSPLAYGIKLNVGVPTSGATARGYGDLRNILIIYLFLIIFIFYIKY